MSYDFTSWRWADLLHAIRYIENASKVTTMSASGCGCDSYTRGGGVCWCCLMGELQKRMSYSEDDLSQILCLAQLNRYDEIRKNDTSHNLALMLALKQGPAGYCHPPAAGRRR